EPARMVVQHVDPEAERQVALELRAAAAQHEAAALLASGRELLQQARLADARLAAHRHEARGAAQRLQLPAHGRELAAAADEGSARAARRHATTLTGRERGVGESGGVRWVAWASEERA